MTTFKSKAYHAATWRVHSQLMLLLPLYVPSQNTLFCWCDLDRDAMTLTYERKLYSRVFRQLSCYVQTEPTQLYTTRVVKHTFARFVLLQSVLTLRRVMLTFALRIDVRLALTTSRLIDRWSIVCLIDRHSRCPGGTILQLPAVPKPRCWGTYTIRKAKNILKSTVGCSSVTYHWWIHVSL